MTPRYVGSRGVHALDGDEKLVTQFSKCDVYIGSQWYSVIWGMDTEHVVTSQCNDTGDRRKEIVREMMSMRRMPDRDTVIALLTLRGLL